MNGVFFNIQNLSVRIVKRRILRRKADKIIITITIIITKTRQMTIIDDILTHKTIILAQMIVPWTTLIIKQSNFRIKIRRTPGTFWIISLYLFSIRTKRHFSPPNNLTKLCIYDPTLSKKILNIHKSLHRYTEHDWFPSSSSFLYWIIKDTWTRIVFPSGNELHAV